MVSLLFWMTTNKKWGHWDWELHWTTTTCKDHSFRVITEYQKSQHYNSQTHW